MINIKIKQFSGSVRKKIKWIPGAGKEAVKMYFYFYYDLNNFTIFKFTIHCTIRTVGLLILSLLMVRTGAEKWELPVPHLGLPLTIGA